MPRSWKITIGTTAVALVTVLAIGLAQSDADNRTPTARVGQITEMEQSGEMSRMLEQHRQMIARMQENASPAMLELMRNDPMWQMMRTPEWAQMDEQHQADIDRMLGK